MSQRFMLRRAQQKHPHDFLEDLALSNEWRYERSADHKISIDVDGFACKVTLVSHWDEHAGYLELTAIFFLMIPEKRKKDVFEVLTALTLDSRLGSFSLCPEEETPFFRHSFFAYPKNPITLRHLTDTLEELLSGAEKLCQALYFLLEEQKTSQEAVFASLIDVVGEA